MMKNGKIVMFSSSLGKGGAERRITYLSNYFNHRGYKVIIALSRREGNYLEELNREIRIKELTLFKKSFNGISTLFKIIMLIIVEKPSVLFSNLYGMNRFIILTRLFFKKNPKIVIGVVNNPLKAYRNRGFIRKFYPMADILLANSNGIKESMIVNWNIRPEKIEVIHNGIDVENVKKKSRQNVILPKIPSNHKILISNGKLSVQKGFECLIEAVKLVNQLIPCSLIILGEGPEYQRLNFVMNKLGLQDIIHLLGYKINPYAYLKKADVFVLSSVFEGFPNVILEAMACGVPVVATAAPFGPDEIIDNGNDGFLVNVGDYKGIAEKVIELLNNRELRNKFISNAEEKLKIKFTFDVMCKKYEDLFFNFPKTA